MIKLKLYYLWHVPSEYCICIRFSIDGENGSKRSKISSTYGLQLKPRGKRAAHWQCNCMPFHLVCWKMLYGALRCSVSHLFSNFKCHFHLPKLVKYVRVGAAFIIGTMWSMSRVYIPKIKAKNNSNNFYLPYTWWHVECICILGGVFFSI